MINLYRFYNKPEKLDMHNVYYKPLQHVHYNVDDSIMHIIKKEPRLTYYYAQDVIKGRWQEAEPYIMKDPYYAYMYANYIIQYRWREAEQYIMKDPYYAYLYAYYVINNRWPEAEKYIREDEGCWQSYYRQFKLC